MLTILTGPDRQAGLSQLIDTICARAAEGIGEQILIVPEQYSFEAERALCRRGGDTISRFAEVLSFTRLASRVFSIYGGVSEEYLDEGGRLLCLYLAAERVKTQIKFYAASLLRPEFLLQLGKMMEEFLTCCVTPQQLLTAAGQMTGQQAQKLSELGLLYESYLSVCKTGRADPVTRLSRLAETLSQEDYCAGKRFYLAGFSDFTAVQLRILDAIFPQAEQTQVYLCTDGSDNAAFRCGAQTAKQLSRMAARRNIAVVREQVSERTCRPASLELWLSQIMNTGGAPFSEPAPEVALGQADTRAGACELAAGIVQKLTRTGVRWREIAVACTESGYVQAIKPMLQRAGIGAYYAGTTDILGKPLLQAVMSAMQAASRFSFEDVMQYLKSGFSPLEPDACDRLERYA